MTDNLEKLAWLVNHSRRTLNIIKQNVTFSLAVKAAFAGAIFANKATLWMAVLSDMGTSLLVVSNGLRLLNSEDTSTIHPQSILTVEKSSIPALTNLQDVNHSSLPLTSIQTPDTSIAQPKSACKDCKKGCQKGGKGTTQATVTLEDKSDIV